MNAQPVNPMIAAKGDEKSALQSELKSFAARDFSMVIALVLIWGFFALVRPAFIKPFNVSGLAVEVSITAVLAIGQLLIIVAGEIDLSIGSGVGLMGGIAAVLISWHGWSAGSSMAVTVLVSVAVWLLMGWFIVTQRVISFIITLAGMLIFRGIQWKVIHSETVPVVVGGQSNLMSLLTVWYLPPMASSVLVGLVIMGIAVGAWRTRRRRAAFGFALEPAGVAFSKVIVLGQLLVLFLLVCNEYQGIPLSVLILAATASAIAVLMGHTRFGRYLYAIGGNKEAALISGVPVRNILIGVFGIMGFLVALSGFLQAAYAGANTTSMGSQMELDAVAACVIGGTSLKGGKGTVLGVIFGSLIMASLLNGMNLMSLPPEDKLIARGVVLALAVWLDMKLAKP